MKTIIFDMDGVLVDTEPLYADYVLQFYQRFQQPLSFQEVKKLAGSSSHDSWRMMGEWWNPQKTPEEMKDFYERYIDHEPLRYEEVLNPYVRYILPRLKAKGYQLAIASSSPKKEILQMCKECRLTMYFDQLVSGHEFKKSKPDPTIYLETMKRLNSKPQETIIIEDSNYGIQAAYATGAHVIAKRDDRFGYDQSLANEHVYDLLEAYHKIMDRGDRNDRKENRLYR